MFTYPFEEKVNGTKEADYLSSETKIVRWHMLNGKRWLKIKLEGSVEMEQWKSVPEYIVKNIFLC